MPWPPHGTCTRGTSGYARPGHIPRSPSLQVHPASRLGRRNSTGTGSRRCLNVLSRHETGAHDQLDVPMGHLHLVILCTYCRLVSNRPFDTCRHPTKGDPLPGVGGPISLGWANLHVSLGSVWPKSVTAKDRLVPYQSIQAHTSPVAGSTGYLTVAAVYQVGGHAATLVGTPSLVTAGRNRAACSQSSTGPHTRLSVLGPRSGIPRPAASGLWPQYTLF